MNPLNFLNIPQTTVFTAVQPNESAQTVVDVTAQPVGIRSGEAGRLTGERHIFSGTTEIDIAPPLAAEVLKGKRGRPRKVT